MNQASTLPLTALFGDRSRSMGIKLMVVSFLALLMAIPAIFVTNIIEERTKRAKDVTQEISNHVGGPQTFLGPVLTIPYSVPPTYKGGTTATGYMSCFLSKQILLLKCARRSDAARSSRFLCIRQS